MDVVSGWLNRLRCPSCDGSVRRNEASVECTSCAARYPVRAGVVRMVSEEQGATAETFNAQYDALRLKEGWASDIPGFYEALPYKDLTGRNTVAWRQRVRSYQLVQRWLENTLGTGTVSILDYGAGSGWLSRMLAERYDVAAMDINEGIHGLSAIPESSRHYSAIQSSLERIPLHSGCCDAVVANASLHYASTPDAPLEEVHRILKPEGIVVIMDSPTYPSIQGVQQAMERSHTYFCEMGFPDLADHYSGLTDALFKANDLFLYRSLRKDFSIIELMKKRFREAMGQSESARFPVWIGRKL